MRAAFYRAGGKQLEGPVHVQIEAIYRIPASTSAAAAARMENGEILPTVKPDLDNIAKIVCDALNGAAYRDDAQIVLCAVSKRYAREPGLTVRVFQADGQSLQASRGRKSKG